MKIVLMGVTGSGKSTIGAALAEKLGITFIDSDNLHPESNKKKMNSGTPLSDSDRLPWLQAVSNALQSHEEIVVACSALKKNYRAKILADSPKTQFIHLAGSRELISARLSQRKHEFMPIELLDSQFETLEPLEPGERGRIIEISPPVEEIVKEISTWF